MLQSRIAAALDEKMATDEVRSLLEIHLKTPGKVSVYYDALSKCLINGHVVFTAMWSWWAFIGGPWYFFYRKMYKPGLIMLGISILLCFVPIPFGSAIICVAAAIMAKYLYCKKFVSDLEIAGYPEKSGSEISRSLGVLGGYNSWAIWAGVIVNIIILLAALAAVLIGSVFSIIGLSNLILGLSNLPEV
ncbi:hypothetical protein FACS1894216_06320 [Synergistales bacterium]|nr:hypothetical protein FACS1894216_06320 [Synergistales bacterium]